MRLALLSLLLACSTLSGPRLAAAESSRGPAPIEIVDLEQHLWNTMAQGDFAQVRKLFAPDFIQVDDHIESLDILLVELKHCKITAYDLRDLQVRILTPESAMTAYHVVSTFDCGTPDKPLTKEVDNNSVTIWVRQPGTQHWLIQAHTETPAKP